MLVDCGQRAMNQCYVKYNARCIDEVERPQTADWAVKGVEAGSIDTVTSFPACDTTEDTSG